MSLVLNLFLVTCLIGYAACHITNWQDGESYTSSREGVCSMFSSSFQFLGELYLSEKGKVVTIKGTLKGLPPNSQLGFHVHSYGNFSDPVNMCDSTGPHFNPSNKMHGCPRKKKSRHAGDFGNIKTNAAGVASISIKTISITLAPGERNVFGRAIVVHMGMDDCGKGGNPGSLTNGNSGTRIACCAIGVTVCAGWR